MNFAVSTPLFEKPCATAFCIGNNVKLRMESSNSITIFAQRNSLNVLTTTSITEISV